MDVLLPVELSTFAIEADPEIAPEVADDEVCCCCPCSCPCCWAAIVTGPANPEPALRANAARPKVPLAILFILKSPSIGHEMAMTRLLDRPKAHMVNQLFASAWHR